MMKNVIIIGKYESKLMILKINKEEEYNNEKTHRK